MSVIKKNWFKYLSHKRIEQMDASTLNSYLTRGETLLNSNIRQFNKPQKQFGGKTGYDAGWGGHVENLKFVSDLPTDTMEEKREKLYSIVNEMKKDYFTPSQAAIKEREYRKNKEYEAWDGAFKETFYGDNASELTFTERQQILENTRGVFAKFSKDEIERIGSGNILKAAIKFRDMGLSYREYTKRAVLSVKTSFRYQQARERAEATKAPTNSPFSIINK